MIMRYTLVRTILGMIDFMWAISLSAQQYSIVDVSPVCGEAFSGSIQIQLLPDQMEEDWVLAFDVDWQNTTTGNTESTVFNGYNGGTTATAIT